MAKISDVFDNFEELFNRKVSDEEYEKAKKMYDDVIQSQGHKKSFSEKDMLDAIIRQMDSLVDGLVDDIRSVNHALMEAVNKSDWEMVKKVMVINSEMVSQLKEFSETIKTISKV